MTRYALRMPGIRSGPAGRSRLAGLALLITLVLAPAAGALPVAAAPQFTWLNPITLENAGGSHAITAVSCPTSTQCTSVDAGGQQVTFNPTTGATVADSSVEVSGRPTSVSCASASQCTAVDDVGNRVTFNPVSGAVLNGGVDTVGSSDPLSSIACPTTTICVTVNNQGVARTLNPSTGVVAATNGLGPAALTSVSCKSDGTQCVTVTNAGFEITFDPATGTSSAHDVDGALPLTSVSCRPDLSLCTAVDNHGNEVTFDPSTGTVSGTVHSIDGTTPLTSLSCASDGTQCSAVDTQGTEITFAPSTGAAIGGSPQSIDGITRLNGVACPTGTDTQCSAVDNTGNEVTFNPANSQLLAGGAHSVSPHVLGAVTCPTASQCTALDAAQREITFDPTTGAVTGQDGHGAVGASVIDTTGNGLISLSCPSATQCTAVDHGSFKTTFNPQTGQPNSAGTANIENGRSLQAVSCPDTHQCTAVDTGGNQVTFDPGRGADGVNNVSPNPIDPVSSDKLLISVVCRSDTACVAVDHAGNEITFDPTSVNSGTPTTIETGQHPSSLSCPSATQCTAVDDGGRAVTFDPTTIANTQTDTAGPTAVDGSTPLNAVSCPSVSSCVAVDGGGNEIRFDPTNLGSRSSESVPQAAGLQGVSCNTTYECTVVDAEGNGFGGFLTPVSSAAPTITGTLQQGNTLTEHHGTWLNYPPSAYAYQWEDCDDSGCSPIAGAAGATYSLQASDVGETIAVQETATNLGGDSQPASSVQTTVVLPPAPVTQGPPTIVGTVAQGQTLTEQHGLWSNNPTGIADQWQLCNSAGLGCASIPGATGRSYTPVASDVGKTLVVLETASNAGGTSPAAASAATAPIAAARAANILATTLAADHLGASSAQLHGMVYTQGAPASWQFAWGTTTALGHTTPLQSLAAGNTSDVGVLASVTGLKPGTTYFVQLVETVSPSAFRTGVQSKGKVLKFTTALAGQLRLKKSQLTVTGRDAVASVGCSAPVNCTGELTLTATRQTGGRLHPRSHTLRCGRARLSISRGHRRQVSLALSSACRTLLRRQSPDPLPAQLTADSTSGQHGFSQGVQLSG
ncbi:MAG: hypothetical protein ACJ76X_15385 [Solirubrobacteraceae bacterium]